MGRVWGRGIVLAAALGLAGCAETELVAHAVKTVAGPTESPAQGGHYKVGNPYQVFGKWYYPAEDPDYDQTGIASWYGPGFHGLKTANGEMFDENAMTAAHTTLPMPSYVRVTNLANGRAVVLRVNDRGPFVDDRIIDVSRRAAQLLGFYNQGTTQVRVEAVAPPEEAEVLVAQNDTSEPTMQIAAVPAASVDVAAVDASSATAVAPPAGDTSIAHIYVQVGAFGDQVNAQAMQARVAALGQAAVVPFVSGTKSLYRVRFGPYISREEANLMLSRVWAAGITEARLATD